MNNQSKSKYPLETAALEAAIKKAGSQDNLADLCNKNPSIKPTIKQQHVHKWVRIQQRLPAEHVLTVEKYTGVSRHSLRPDIYPVEQSISSSDNN